MPQFTISRRPLRRLYSDVVASPPHLPPSRVLPAAEKKTAPAVALENKSGTETVKVPDPKFFAQLKLEEQKQFSYKKRTRFTYKNNYSASLALPYSKKQLEKKQNNQNALLEMSEKYVIEHESACRFIFLHINCLL